ncbi:MAG: outer membrane beta-barrel protein [Muribaculaceae bacterium]|nr:outer membrane beta-barrel protein [Muribaculaceae bacterium]
MKRLTTLLLLISVSIICMQARTIQGMVLSSNDSTAVAGANCKLTTGDKFLTASSTGENGRFSLETDAKDALNLDVSMPGYASSQIIIEQGGKSLDVGIIYLDDAKMLDEVTVSSTQVVHSKGRTIVYPSAFDVKSSSTAISLFQKLPLPGLEANPIMRSISVDGGSPTILINGVPSSMDDVNALQPKDIEKIEYSRFTPARYAARGGKGFINVILKKRDDGGQAYLWGRSAVTTAFVDASLRASYHQGPSQFTLTYTPSWRNYQDVYDNTTESYIGNDFRVNLESHDRNPFYYHSHNVRLKYDYSPSLKTLFSATFSVSPFFDKRRSIANTMDSELGDYSNDNTSKSDALTPSLDLFLRHDFNDANSLEAQVVGSLSSSDYRRDNKYFFADGSEDIYSMNVDNRRRSLISEISYIHNFNNSLQLSAGYQNTVSHSTNTYLSSDYKPVLTENNNYIYARLGYSIGKVYLSLSTGAKLFWIKNDANKRNFIRNISKAYFMWSVSQNWSIDGAFQYTPGIPSLSSLTDYQQQVSPYLISNGNPDLKVSNYYLFQISPSYQYKKFSASLIMSYSTVDNFVMSDVRYIGNRLFLSQSINARKNWNTFAYLNLKISDIAGFGANLSLNLVHYETMGDDWSHHLTSFDASLTLWWNKGPFTVSYWRRIPGKYLSGNNVGKGENGDALQLEYRPNKHWTIGASWMYMFDKKGTRYPAWNYSAVNPMTRERYIENNGNMVVLSVSYSADFGSIFRTARRNLNNSDNGSSLLKM